MSFKQPDITMTPEEKILLLKDLCGRLPYHPILNWKFIDNTSKDEELKELSDLYIWWITKAQDCEVKLYLRPMSSMTKEEFLEYHNIKYNKVTYRNNWKRIDVGKFHDVGIIPIEEYLDWLNKHHFDYRGLIEMGLALEAPEGMYNI